ncbi:hypothetical protein M407DRAFT_22851 [Tulasnella calospora MUT 4182]|uniref:Uncharacterized protein n=1 Tax=Tulasnella calospora MUT 4182 TaxID=1051891 RepID=A0A0C3QMA9_9AGAM|nr:hypothetical protein M407DRAFT_22851 [Tulasnella calospora MUT 4182]
MIAWRDSNGTTLTDPFLANVTKSTSPPSMGVQVPNYLDSLIRASMRTGKGLNVSISDVFPMVHPNDLVLGGWNISAPLDTKRDTQVLDYDVQRQVRPYAKRGLDRVVAFWTALLKTPSCLGASSPASNTSFIFGNDLKTSQAKTPDHIVVIKHVPAVGDSRRPSTNIYKLIMGARDPLTIFNECEDSLRLPSHLRLDNSRRPLHSRSISSRPEHKPLYPILSPCRTCSRRPSVKPGHDVVNPWEGAESTIDGPDEAPPVKSTLQTSLPPTKMSALTTKQAHFQAIAQ